jgi:hypothetical protein
MVEIGIRGQHIRQAHTLDIIKVSEEGGVKSPFFCLPYLLFNRYINQ